MTEGGSTTTNWQIDADGTLQSPTSDNISTAGTVTTTALIGDGTGARSGYLVSVEDVVADNILVASESGKLFTNLGDAGLQTTTLPTASAGVTSRFSVVAAFEVRIDPAAGDHLIYSGGAMADGEYLTSTTVGSSLRVTALSSGDWLVEAEQGTWAEETP